MATTFRLGRQLKIAGYLKPGRNSGSFSGKNLEERERACVGKALPFNLAGPHQFPFEFLRQKIFARTKATANYW